MLNNICCVINAHREGNVLFPTILSVKRAVKYAWECGLTVDIHVILDNADTKTKEIADRELSDSAVIHEVMFKDLAHSRNYAVTVSTSQYIAFVDGDDLWSRNWLVDSYVMAQRCDKELVLHPEYNIFFGSKNDNHVFNHVDMDSQDFEFESLYWMNYWTALSFAKSETYQSNPYRKNSIMEGFGYEDWTWNYETIAKGIKHKVVPGTAHFIRKSRPQDSLLAQTNKLNAVPRILDIYRVPAILEVEDNQPSQVPVIRNESNIQPTSAEVMDQQGALAESANQHVLENTHHADYGANEGNTGDETAVPQDSINLA